MTPGHLFLGLFGGGVLTYFSFLRWLFLVNIYIFVLVFTFITIPQLTFPSDDTNSTVNVTINVSASSKELRAAVCSQLYVVDTEGVSDSQAYVDFLQGTVSISTPPRVTTALSHA